MKKFRAVALVFGSLALASSLSVFSACGKEDKIVIWTSGEDYKNNFYLTSLRENSPIIKSKWSI